MDEDFKSVLVSSISWFNNLHFEMGLQKRGTKNGVFRYVKLYPKMVKAGRTRGTKNVFYRVIIGFK